MAKKKEELKAKSGITVGILNVGRMMEKHLTTKVLFYQYGVRRTTAGVRI